MIIWPGERGGVFLWAHRSSYGGENTSRPDCVQYRSCVSRADSTFLDGPVSVRVRLCRFETTANANGRLIISENTTRDAAYFEALAADYDLGRTRGIDTTLAKFDLDAIILPTDGTLTSLFTRSRPTLKWFL